MDEARYQYGLEKVLFKVNDVVVVGPVIARIRTEVGESISATPIIKAGTGTGFD
jgi:hypothetical protein